MHVRARRTWWLAAAAVVGVACGDDGSVVFPDAGGDAGGRDGGAMDAGRDSAPPDARMRDAGADAEPTDGGSDGALADGALADGALPDGALPDGGADAATDAGCTTEVSWEACTDGFDNDCDGETDSDEGCAVCPPTSDRADEESGACADGIDNDCDGFVDCVDFDCRDDTTACPDEATDALCSDGLDNDGDERIDCLSRSCVNPEGPVTVCTADPVAAAEDSEALCDDRLDNDGDGVTDCDDDGCDGVGFCTVGSAAERTVSCSDGEDNDGDGRPDCLDSDCRGEDHCMGEGDDATCSDGLDNDNDGPIDCADSSCYLDPAVEVCFDAVEDCANDADDDHDGLVDCFDPSCEATCSVLACGADNPVGTCPTAGQECGLGGECGAPLSAFDFDAEMVLLVTELMPDPIAVTDANGEYVEILNVSGGPVMIAGLTIEDAGGSSVTFQDRIILSAGEHVVYGANDDIADNGGIEMAGELPFRLDQSGETITVSFNGAPIHMVTYPGPGGSDLENTGAAAIAGQSFQLDQAYLDDMSGVTPGWCETPDETGNDYNMSGDFIDYGTPGASNLACL